MCQELRVLPCGIFSFRLLRRASCTFSVSEPRWRGLAGREGPRGRVIHPVASVLQLIDLTSPLIQLSPEADKENVDSPLLKF